MDLSSPQRMEKLSPDNSDHVSQCNKVRDGDDGGKVQRQYGDFHPDIWGEFFINNPPPFDPESDSWMKQRSAELIEQVKLMLKNATETIEKIHLIDALQRLGISYHFKLEIDETLNQLNKTPVDCEELYVVALQFRLLRQNRYYASSDVFKKFIDEDGKFKASLSSDIRSLLSLYEAAYFGIPSEDILNEAISFTQSFLKSRVEDLPVNLKAMVSCALDCPIAMKMSRNIAKEYINIYQDDEETCNQVILELANLDFHMLQLLYRKEIRESYIWWKKLDLAKRLNYIRDRIVECYVWAYAIYDEPKHSWNRIVMTQVMELLTIIDDTFDAYGKPDELEKFNDAIQRWDISAVDELPEYMKPLYKSLLEYFEDVEHELSLHGKAYHMDYLKESMKEQVSYYFKESKWAHQGYVPTVEEHLSISFISIAFKITICSGYVGLEEEATKAAFEWLARNPKLLKAACRFTRIKNDMAAREIDQKRIHVASTVKCYMKEHGVSREEAHEKLREMLQKEWRIMVHEFLEDTEIPMSLVLPIFGLIRGILGTYKHMDSFTNSSTHMKDYIVSMFVQLLPI